jgi:hypothetical protein
VFASAAARDAAVTSPQEGNACYLKDTNEVLTYNGSTWVAVGGGSPLTTKGDLYGFGTSDARIPIGANNTVLTADSGETLGLKWAALSSGAVNKNYLINGGFAVAQRGTSFTAGANNDDAYTLDRWYILSDTNDVIDVTQDTSTVPTNGQFAIALDVETVNKKFGIATIIENKDVIGLVGNTVTFSFKAKVSATTKLDNVKAAIVAWSGTADTVTSDIISAWGAEGTNPTLIANATYENSPVNLNLTTSYATYSVSGAVDTASTKNLILFIWSDVTDTTLGDFVYIAEAKLELGSSATSFVYSGDSFSGEVANCQRYYEKSYNLTVNPGTATGAGAPAYSGGFESNATTNYIGQCAVRFAVSKRGVPTITMYDLDGNVNKINRTTLGGAGNNNQSVFTGDTGQSGFNFFGGTSSSNDKGIIGHFLAESEL